MKRTIIAAGALALAGGIFLMPNALAEPSDACDGAQVDGVVAQDSDSVTVCITQGAVTGNATAEGSADDPSTGSVIADGDSTNSTPSAAMGGYIGADGDGVASSGCPAEYSGQRPDDDLDPEGLVEFLQSGGVSQCDADGTPAD